MKYIVSLNGKQHEVSVDGEERIRLDGELTSPDIRRVGKDAYSVLINGQSVRVVAQGRGNVYQVLLGSLPYEAIVESERDAIIRKYAHSKTSINSGRRTVKIA